MTLIARLQLRLRFELRSVLSSYETLFLTILRFRRRYRHVLVDGETGLVIEGFPRSSNTFASVAFELSQRHPVKVARHTHAPATIFRALRWGKPVLLLVRPPRDAVISLMIYRPEISARQALRAYVRFHRALLPVCSRCVVATFDQVTRDFGSVIEKVNRCFGTTFEVFDHTPANVSQCMRRVEDLEERDSEANIREERVPRPSQNREALKKDVAPILAAPALKSYLQKAESLYRAFQTRAADSAALSGCDPGESR